MPLGLGVFRTWSLSDLTGRRTSVAVECHSNPRRSRVTLRSPNYRSTGNCLLSQIRLPLHHHLGERMNRSVADGNVDFVASQNMIDFQGFP